MSQEDYYCLRSRPVLKRQIANEQATPYEDANKKVKLDILQSRKDWSEIKSLLDSVNLPLHKLQDLVNKVNTLFGPFQQKAEETQEQAEEPREQDEEPQEQDEEIKKQDAEPSDGSTTVIRFTFTIQH